VIVMVAGVAGSGKSTVGARLAARLHWEFMDGDSLHSAANVAKMHAGVPLTDADRGPWLRALAHWTDQRRAAGVSAVVACSALHRAYREQLLAGRPDVRLVFLMVSREVAAARLAVRHSHFFPARLLDSQFRELEPPAPDEPVLVLDAGRPLEELVTAIITALGLA
jgi:carbohydrate kinase (thermoresistant glucokinase family)